MNKEIGERIKAIRLSKKLYPKDIGSEIGMLQTSYSKIERGGNTTVETILKIAKALDVSAAKFFEDEYIVAEPLEKMRSAESLKLENLEQTVSMLVKRLDDLFPLKAKKKAYKASPKKSRGKSK